MEEDAAMKRKASATNRGCTPEFSHAKKKKSFGSTYARNVEPNKASRPSHIPFLPRLKNCRSHTTPPLPESTPVILLLPLSSE